MWCTDALVGNTGIKSIGKRSGEERYVTENTLGVADDPFFTVRIIEGLGIESMEMHTSRCVIAHDSTECSKVGPFQTAR